MAPKKKLNLMDVFCVTAGAMMSSGIFLLPGLAFERIGPAILIAYLFASILALTGVFSQAELSSAMPKAGGSYFYIHRSLGPAVGTVYGLVTWLSLILKAAFELFGLAALAVLVLKWGGDYKPVIAALFCIPIVAINLLGIKEAGRVQVILVVGIIGVLVAYVIYGFDAVDVQHFKPFNTGERGWLSIFSTAGFVFVSYGGLLKVATVAEEVHNPGKTIPLGMIASLLVVTVIYLLVIFITAGTLGLGMAGSLAPIYNGAEVFMGPIGLAAVAIASALAFISAANAGVMSSSRFPMALSWDGLVPEHLGRVNERFHTPHLAILVTGAFMVLSLFLPLEILVKAASSVLILTYLFSCLAVIILRESRLQNYQPRFKSPLYPVTQVVGLLGCGFLLYELGAEALRISALLVVSGLVFYWFYGRIRAGREYALLHLIERMTARELTDHGLETELKEIVRERDEILKDRFDHLIEECPVVDMQGASDLEGFFRVVCMKMAPHLDLDVDVLYEKLMEREKASTTALNPYLAIPHIIVEGNGAFDILLARSVEGIHWSGSAPKVHAVFVLAGSMDERHFHLTCLAAIAQIVQDPEFERRWMSAKTLKALRDVVLLSKRKRHFPD